MLQPKRPLDLTSAKQILEEDQRKPLDLSSAEAILKKKDGTKPQSPSTTPSVNTESVQTSGSLGIFPKPKINNEREEASVKKDVVEFKQPRKITTTEKDLIKEGEAFRQLANQKVKNYRQATKVTPQEKEAVVLDLESKKEKQGVLNGIKSGLKEGWNAFVDVIGVGGSEETKNAWKSDIEPLQEEKKEAIDFFKSQKIKPTPEQIDKKADELYVNKKTLQIKQDKINDYLSSLDEQEKTYLEVDAQNRLKKVSKERQDAFNRISLNEKYLLSLLDEQNKAMTLEDKKLISSEIDKIAKYLDEDQKLINKSESGLGTAEEELEIFKKNYNVIDNIGARIASSIGEGAVSFFEGLEYLGTLGGNLDPTNNVEKVLAQTGKAKQGIQEFRQEFRPENEEITLDNFLQYSADLLSNQSGTLLTMASAGSTGGASILGLGQAGQTYSEMYKENKKSAKYTPAQMALAPFVSGVSTGVLSASPTFETLKNAGNVWKATLKGSATKELADQAIKNTTKKVLSQIGKDTQKEVATELLDNTIQNAVKRDILGDKSVGYFDNSWKVIKDTALLTGLLNSGALPQVTMSAVKMFTPSEMNKILDSNGSKIIELSKQLDNINLDDNAKKLVENQISELTKSSEKIIDNTIKKIDGLTEEEVKKVVQYESRKQKILNQAEEIKENPELSIKSKKTVLDGSSEEYKNVVEKSNEIIDAEIKKPIVQEKQESQPQAEEQAQVTEVELSVPDKFKKSVDLFNQINEADGGSKKRELARQRKEFLEQNPTIKFVDDNIREITRQLEERGELQKKGDCP